MHVKVENIISFDAIEPLGKNLVFISCHDANLCHNVINIIHITRVLYFVRKNPAEWYSKKKATVKTATYGSENLSSYTCVEEIFNPCIALRYLGVPLRNKIYIFGDNKSFLVGIFT